MSSYYLSQEETVELIKSLPDSEVETTLLKGHEALVWLLVKQYKTRGIMDADERFSLGYIGLLKAIKTYQTCKGKFSTYAGICITNEIRMGFRRERKHRRTYSFQDKVSPEDNTTFENILMSKVNIEEYIIRLDDIETIKKALSCLPEKINKIMTLYHIKGKSQAEIASCLGYSQSHISRMLTTGLKLLRDMYDDDGYYKMKNA